jgi:hypothetical protein
LSLAAYGASKMVVFGALAALEALLFGACLHLMLRDFRLDLSTGVLTVAASLGGTLLGLLISALSPRVSAAVSWLPMLFIPQIFFSGIMVPFDRMTRVGRVLSHVTVSRPVFSLFKKSCLLEQSIWSRDEWLTMSVLFAAVCILTFSGIRWRMSRFGMGR